MIGFFILRNKMPKSAYIVIKDSSICGYDAEITNALVTLSEDRAKQYVKELNDLQDQLIKAANFINDYQLNLDESDYDTIAKLSIEKLLELNLDEKIKEALILEIKRHRINSLLSEEVKFYYETVPFEENVK